MRKCALEMLVIIIIKEQFKVRNTHTHMEQGMYNYVQKAEGESAGESEGLLLKEVSFKVSF